MKAYSFSRAGILAMPLPEKNNQVLYPDPETRFHYVRVTSNGARSFVVDRNTPRGRIRITLGQAGTDALTAEQARKSALIVLGLIEQGFTAGQIKDRLARVDERVPEGAVTLGQVFEEYLQDRTGKLSERTVSDYRRLMDSHLNDWRHKPVETIDEAAVRAKFHSIKSPSRANYTMRLLRALLNLGKSINSDTGTPVVSINPVQILSNRKLWHREEPKREVIDLAALPAWWRAVEKLGAPQKVKRDAAHRFEKGSAALNSNGETVRDFLQFLLLTGLRRSEAATLQWSSVDLKAKLFTVQITKNREPHTLPLSDYLLNMLKRRLALSDKETDPVKKPFVFSGEVGPLAEPKKQIKKVVTASGVKFSSHTLRRTFASIAESLDIPYLALKRLLNHKAQDVTGRHYTVIGAERLRDPMQKITRFTLKAAGKGRQTVSPFVRSSHDTTTTSRWAEGLT